MSVAHQAPSLPDHVRLWGDLTWEEYLQLEDPPGFSYEYDEGRLIVSPSGKNAHSEATFEIASRLRDYQKKTGRRHCIVFVEQSFFMPPGRRDLRPDVSVITDERRTRLDPDGYPEGAPDIAIEVLSERTEQRDRGLKAARYYEEGADELWLFDPRTGEAEFYRRGPDGWSAVEPVEARYETPLLPGFALDVNEL